MASLSGHPFFSDMSQPTTHRAVIVEQFPLYVCVAVDMPGLQKEHVSMRKDGNNLVVTSEGPLDPHEGDRRRYKAVIQLSAARETFVDSAVSVMENGVFTTDIPSIVVNRGVPDVEPTVVEYTPHEKYKAFAGVEGSLYVRLDIAGLKREQVRVSRDCNKLSIEGVDRRPGDPEPRRKFGLMMIMSGLTLLVMTDEMKRGVIKLFFSERN